MENSQQPKKPAFAPSRQPKAVLRNWYFKPKKPSSYRIQLIGLNAATPVEAVNQNEFCTAVIRRRLDRHLVQTDSGSIYQLEGPCDAVKMGLIGGYLEATMRMFKMGFPTIWKEYLKEDWDRREYDRSYHEKTASFQAVALRTTLPVGKNDTAASSFMASKSISCVDGRPAAKAPDGRSTGDDEPQSTEIPVVPSRTPPLQNGANLATTSAASPERVSTVPSSSFSPEFGLVPTRSARPAPVAPAKDPQLNPRSRQQQTSETRVLTPPQTLPQPVSGGFIVIPTKQTGFAVPRVPPLRKKAQKPSAPVLEAPVTLVSSGIRGRLRSAKAAARPDVVVLETLKTKSSAKKAPSKRKKSSVVEILPTILEVNGGDESSSAEILLKVPRRVDAKEFPPSPVNPFVVPAVPPLRKKAKKPKSPTAEPPVTPSPVPSGISSRLRTRDPNVSYAETDLFAMHFHTNKATRRKPALANPPVMRPKHQSSPEEQLTVLKIQQVADPEPAVVQKGRKKSTNTKSAETVAKSILKPARKAAEIVAKSKNSRVAPPSRQTRKAPEPATRTPSPSPAVKRIFFPHLADLPPSDYTLPVVSWADEAIDPHFQAIDYHDMTRTMRMSGGSRKRRRSARDAFEPSSSVAAANRLNRQTHVSGQALKPCLKPQKAASKKATSNDAGMASPQKTVKKRGRKPAAAKGNQAAAVPAPIATKKPYRRPNNNQATPVAVKAPKNAVNRPRRVSKALKASQADGEPARKNRTVGWFREAVKQVVKPPTASKRAPAIQRILFPGQATLSPSNYTLPPVNWDDEQMNASFEAINYTDTTRTFRMSAAPKRKARVSDHDEFEPSNAQNAVDRLNFQGFLQQERDNRVKQPRRGLTDCTAGSTFWGANSTMGGTIVNIVVPSLPDALLDED